MVDSEQDQLLPIANVGRIMKQILPPTAKISKGAKETMQECVTEFIGFVTGEASDKCHKENRKTVNGDDICWALSSLGFDNYAEVMTRYMLKYREAEREKASNSTTATLAKGLGQGNDQRYHDYDHHHHHHYDHHDHDDDDDDEGANQHGNRALTMPLEFRVIDPKG